MEALGINPVSYTHLDVYKRQEYGGIWTVMPVYGMILIFTSMASLGLPGLNGFVGEFMVIRGAWSVFTLSLIHI